jgi:hypothetical protein
MFQVLVTISQSFVAERDMGAIQKLFMKKICWKNEQMSKISKTIGT